MGLLEQINVLPEKEDFCNQFRARVKETLQNGGAAVTLGPLSIPLSTLGLGLPTMPPPVIEAQIKAIDDFKKTSKQKRSEKKTRKVENKRSELANKREWENLKSQGIVSGDYDPNYFR